MGPGESRRPNEYLAGRQAAAHAAREETADQFQQRVDEVTRVFHTVMERLWVAEEGLDYRDEQLEAEVAKRRHYQDLFCFAPVGYLVTDPDGVIIEANHFVATLLGRERAGLTGRPLSDLLAEEDRAALPDVLNQLTQNGASREWRAGLQRNDGGTVPAALTVSVGADRPDQPVVLRWIFQETARHLAIEERARPRTGRDGRVPGAEATNGKNRNIPSVDEAEVTQLRGLIHGIDAVVWEADPDGWVQFVTRRACELFGYPKEQWLAQPCFWHGITHPDDRPLATASFCQCARYGQDREVEYRIVASDGSIIWVREVLRAARDRYGRVESVRGVMWKINRRKKIERQLYSVRRTLADQVADLTHLHDLTHRLWGALELGPLLEEILAAAASILGAEIGMVRLYDPIQDRLEIVASVGLPAKFLERYGRVPAGDVACGLAVERRSSLIIEDVDSDPSLAPYREAARTGGYRSHFTTLLTSRSGELLGTIASCFRQPHRPPAGQIRLVELFVRQAAEFVENARLNHSLRQADRRKDDALVTLAHELRNPLTVILSAADGLSSDGRDGLPPEAVHDLITRQARLMARLVDDLIEASRVGRGQLELQPEVVDLGSVMACAGESVRQLVQERGHELTIAPPPDPIRLKADPIRLEQVLVNLLTNASRYTEPGGKISLEARRTGDAALIRVRDTGIGIAPEMLTRIFDPFVQAHVKVSLSAPGLGLGLALVKGLVERHGGTVTARSEGPGRGSEFVVHLPLEPPGVVKPPPVANSTAKAPTVATHVLHTLVVDDQPDLARGLARLLASWGHEPLIAHDGPSALDEAKLRRPDLVLLDIGLPAMDGYEVAGRLREAHGADLKIVALTGFGRRSNGEPEQNMLFDHYLVKPVSPEDLRALLEKLARGHATGFLSAGEEAVKPL